MIVINSIVVLSGLIAMIPPLPPLAWIVPTLLFACIGIANVVFSVALLRWKKWGFFGLVGTSILLVVNNLILMRINRVPLGRGRVPFILLAVVILYAALQVGKEKRGWTQLE